MVLQLMLTQVFDLVQIGKLHRTMGQAGLMMHELQQDENWEKVASVELETGPEIIGVIQREGGQREKTRERMGDWMAQRGKWTRQKGRQGL